MEHINAISRREFIRCVSVAGAAGLSLWAGGCEGCLQQINQQIQNRPTRKNIQELWTANPSDPVIVTYKNAVQAMKALPASNTSSWQYQMSIHLNSCIHHNWLWLPWHRVYLLYFERICRKVTGDATFALPYWNWNTHPAVPDPFWDTSSPLYDSNRCCTQADQADSSYIGTSVLSSILAETNFELFASSKPTSMSPPFLHDGANTQGLLEATPHNNIHGFVGDTTCDMGTFQSPLDPVFYTHHCMLDCMWTHWNVDLGNANTNDPDWSNYSITDFFDENGNPVTVAVAITPLFPLLSYQYEPCSLATGGQGQSTGSKLSGKQLEDFLKTGAPSKLEYVQRFEVKQNITADSHKPATAAIKVDASAFTNAIQAGSHNRIVLTVSEVEVPEQRDFYVRVFLNKPDASADTSIDDPHYAGSFGFFYDEKGMGHKMEAMSEPAKSGHAKPGSAKKEAAPARPQTGFVVDVTQTLQNLNQAGSLASEANVTLVPVGYAHRESTGQLKLQKLELAAVRF
jgi:tyrosinase